MKPGRGENEVMNKTGKLIGLAGVGYWGRNLLRNLYNLYELGVLPSLPVEPLMAEDDAITVATAVRIS